MVLDIIQMKPPFILQQYFLQPNPLYKSFKELDAAYRITEVPQLPDICKYDCYMSCNFEPKLENIDTVFDTVFYDCPKLCSDLRKWNYVKKKCINEITHCQSFIDIIELFVKDKLLQAIATFMFVHKDLIRREENKYFFNKIHPSKMDSLNAILFLNDEDKKQIRGKMSLMNKALNSFKRNQPPELIKYFSRPKRLYKSFKEFYTAYRVKEPIPNIPDYGKYVCLLDNNWDKKLANNMDENFDIVFYDCPQLILDLKKAHEEYLKKEFIEKKRRMKIEFVVNRNLMDVIRYFIKDELLVFVSEFIYECKKKIDKIEMHYVLSKNYESKMTALNNLLLLNSEKIN